MKKQALLYIRVSTDEQADKGYSLAYQEDRLKKYCLINNIEVVQLYKEDHSAKTFDRPAFKNMMQFIRRNKSNVDLLLVIKWDRFSRNTRDSYYMIHELHKLNIEVCAIEQHLDLNVPEAKLMLAFYLAAPEVENDRRSLNTFAGMRKARKSGRWINRAPIGYKNVRDANNNPIIVPDERAKYIRKAFEELLSGLFTIEDVRRRLNAKGIKCSRSNFNRLVHNPVYAGKIVVPAYKDEEEEMIDGIHEAIVDENTFWQVQDIIKGRKPRNICKAKTRDELPLRGFIQCSQCGETLTGSASRGRLGTQYYYYHCRNGCTEMATGIKPNTFNMAIENTGVELNATGHIMVNERQETNVPHIYAAGDCTNTPAFVYTAAKEGKVAVLNAFKSSGDQVDYTGLPWVVFTDPQVAGAGMDENEAENAGIPHDTSVIPLSEVPRAQAALDTRGFIKLIRNK
jgi:DNA invertase Pin-like site-specific DNA recombinase